MKAKRKTAPQSRPLRVRAPRSVQDAATRLVRESLAFYLVTRKPWWYGLPPPPVVLDENGRAVTMDAYPEDNGARH